jgi:hypothetical protein
MPTSSVLYRLLIKHHYWNPSAEEGIWGKRGPKSQDSVSAPMRLDLIIILLQDGGVYFLINVKRWLKKTFET